MSFDDLQKKFIDKMQREKDRAQREKEKNMNSNEVTHSFIHADSNHNGITQPKCYIIQYF